MTMPTFEPVAEIRNVAANKQVHEIRAAHFCKGCLPPVGTMLHSADQLTAAYKAGKAAQVEQEPVATWDGYHAIISQVEQIVGYSHGCWDMVPPEELVAAVIKSAPPAPAIPDGLIELLREIRPEYGDVGSRDVDVARKQKQIDEAIALLIAASPEPTK